MGTTVAEITHMLQMADADEFAVLERTLAADTRKGVRKAVEVARRRLEDEALEAARLEAMYEFEEQLAREHGGLPIVGLDEVGRGPLAGPLAVGAVVLPRETHIPGLNDSKQLSPAQRDHIDELVREGAVAWAIEFVEPGFIDSHGISAALRKAFSGAIAQIEAQGVMPATVLIDGNPLHIDAREVNVVKGDAACASIAAASIIAKVARDRLMVELSKTYPGYDFEKSKGYGSATHIAAIKARGLTPVHRASFCSSFAQETLF